MALRTCALALLATLAFLSTSATPALTATGSPALPPGAVVLPDGDIAVPDIGEGPAWWTKEVRDRAYEAGLRGLAYDFERGEDVNPTLHYPHQVLIRPGTQIFPDSIFPGWCTAAFVFGPRALGYDAISTAGHCTLYAGDPVFGLVAPSTVLFFGATRVTTGSGGIGNDWAVIDVDPLWEPATDADVAIIGGPCGEVTATSLSQVPSRTVKHVGHGTAVGTGGTPRVGTLTGLTSTYATYTSITQGGDSGSPVLVTVDLRVATDGEAEDADTLICAEGTALAIHTHTSITSFTPVLKYGTRITLAPGTVANGDYLPARVI